MCFDSILFESAGFDSISLESILLDVLPEGGDDLGSGFLLNTKYFVQFVAQGEALRCLIEP